MRSATVNKEWGVEIMNVEKNQRFQETEKRIFRAYWKLARCKELSKITVADVCREANIHRTTFYGHFLDVYDLQEKVERKQFLMLLQGFISKDGIWDFRDGMRKQIDFYYRNKEVLKLHLQSENKNETYDMFFDFPMEQKYLDSYQKFFHLKNADEVRYHQEFFHAGLTEVVRRWVLSDCRESPEEITDLLCRIFGIDSVDG